MRRTFLFMIALLSAGIFAASQASAGQGLISTMANPSAVGEANGFYLVPAQGVAASKIAGEETTPQVFEVIRPRGEKITIGRLNTSCSCVQVETAKRTYERGERAFLTLRNVRPTPPTGRDYAVYVQIASPIRTTLRIDTFMQSDRFRANTPQLAQAAQPWNDIYMPAASQTYRQPVAASAPGRPVAIPYSAHTAYQY